MRELRCRVSFLAAAALLASALSVGCASRVPTVQAQKFPSPGRSGPETVYRIDRFRLGWYDSIGNLETPSRLASLGFDSVLPYTTGSSIEEIRGFLAEAEKAGIGVHIDITKGRSLEEGGALLEEYVRALRDSPAILSWYLYDEPEWKLKASPRKLEASYSRIQSLDPERPVSMVFILPWLSGPYRDAMDNLWIDYYPISQKSREFSAFRGGCYADHMTAFGRRADRYGLPLTIVPQGFGERENGEYQFWRRLPSLAETRYMFWASFLARPQEVVFWTLYRSQEDWLQECLLPEIRLFRKHFPAIVEYRSSKGFRIVGGRTDSILLGNGKGGQWLLVLNREGMERKLLISVPQKYTIPDSTGESSKEAKVRIDPFGVFLLEVSEIQ